MDEAGDVAATGRRFDERTNGLSRGDIHRCDTRLISDASQHFRRCLGVVLTLISQNQMLSSANPPRDRLPDLTRSDDDNDIFHSSSFISSRT
jgi:hypothetical protein